MMRTMNFIPMKLSAKNLICLNMGSLNVEALHLSAIKPGTTNRSTAILSERDAGISGDCEGTA